MGGNSTSGSTKMDPTQRMITLDSYRRLSDVANQPFQQYGGQWYANPTQDQQTAWGAIRNGQNVGSAGLQQAQAGAQQAMAYKPMTIGSQNVSAQDVTAGNTTAQQVQARTGAEFMGQYFNPFLTQVGGNMVNDMGRARQMQIMSDEDKAIAAGAYGGTRHGVADAETTRGYYDTLGSNLTNMYARGFDTAAGLGQQDATRFGQIDTANADRFLSSDQGNMNRQLTAGISNADRHLNADTGNANRSLTAAQSNQSAGLAGAGLNLSASNALANMSQQQRDNYYQWANALNLTGTQQQQDMQGYFDSERAKYNEWRDYPAQQAMMLGNFASGMPNMGSTTTTTQNQGMGSRLGSAASGALSGAAIGSVVPVVGTAAGAVIGGLGGLVASDEEIKSGVSVLDSEDDVLEGLKKTPVKKWRYDPGKGGPDDGGKMHVGPMAQAMRKNLGIGDGTSLPVVDVMGAHHAAINSLAKKVSKLKKGRK